MRIIGIGIVFSLIFHAQLSCGQMVKAQSEAVFIEVDKNDKSNKPALAYLNVSFKDQTGNQSIESQEQATIRFQIRNMGKFPSQRLFVEARTTNGLSGLAFPEVLVLDSLAAGHSREVSLPISGTRELETGTAEIAIEIREEFEYDPDQIELNVPTEEFKAPELKVTAFKVSSETGKHDPDEPLILKVGVKNQGGGMAANVQLQVKFPSGVKAVDETSFAFDYIAPGEERFGYIEFYMPSVNLAEGSPVEVLIREKLGEYGQDNEFKVILD
jgi:uncharacterized membrane protein